MKTVLGLTAVFFIILNYDIPLRYKRFEKGLFLNGRRTLRVKLLRIARFFGSKWAKIITLLLLTIWWIIFTFYCVMATTTLTSIGITFVAFIAALFCTYIYLMDFRHAYMNFPEWCYSQEDNEILIAKGCWEIVLSSLIVIHMLLQSL